MWSGNLSSESTQVPQMTSSKKHYIRPNPLSANRADKSYFCKVSKNFFVQFISGIQRLEANSASSGLGEL